MKLFFDFNLSFQVAAPEVAYCTHHSRALENDAAKGSLAAILEQYGIKQVRSL